MSTPVRGGGLALGLLGFLTAFLSAQDPDSDRLRSLTKQAPLLPVEMISVKAHPTRVFEGISAVATDKAGNIYVLDRPANGDPVIVLDSQGNVLNSWGQGMFTIPHGIRVDPEGNVWTVDAHTSMVYKFSPRGEKLLEINVGGVPDPTQDFCGATDIAFGPRGRVFVSDGYCNARVIEYDAAGTKVREWGRPGTGPGEFKVVHGIAIGPDGNLYVADRENGRVQWFTLEGKFLGQWQFGGQLFGVAFGPGGAVYVGSHPKGLSLDDEFYLIKLNPATGKMVGKVPVRTHEVSIGTDGTVYPATRNGELLLVRPRK